MLNSQLFMQARPAVLQESTPLIKLHIESELLYLQSALTRSKKIAHKEQTGFLPG